MITYADPSVIVGTLLADAPDLEAVRAYVTDAPEPLLVSEVAVVEVASACMAAARGKRIADGPGAIAKFESWCRPGGRIRLLSLHPSAVFRRATSIMENHRVYALDAIHLAVALEELVSLAGDEPVRFLTRDRIQADAARALGFEVV